MIKYDENALAELFNTQGSYALFQVLDNNGEKAKNAYLLAFCKKDGSTMPLTWFYANMLTPILLGEECLGIYDSHDATEGEIVWQMHFNNRVTRPKLPFGFTIYISESLMDPTVDDPLNNWTVLDNMDIFRRKHILQILGQLLIGVIRRKLSKSISKAYPRSPIGVFLYFCFFGITEAPEYITESASKYPRENAIVSLEKALERKWLRDDFAVFHCVAPMTSSENCYMAIYMEEAALPWGVNSDYITQRNAGPASLYTRNHELEALRQLAQGNYKSRTELFPEENEPEDRYPIGPYFPAEQ